MTTFQDPQPQSRRAVRQSERGNDSEPPDGIDTFAGRQNQPSPRYFSDSSVPAEMWDTTARRAAQLPPASARPAGPSPVTGRRSSGPDAPPVSEPLNYSTQAREPASTYDGQSFRSRQRTHPQADNPEPATQALPQADEPSYRVRDFSPEGRRSTPPGSTTAPTWGAPQPPLAPIAESWRVAPHPALEHEQTLTRREFRALQEAQQAVSTPPTLQEPRGRDVFDTLLQSGPIELPLLALPPQPTTSMSHALAEFDSLANGAQLVEPAAWSLTPSTWAAAPPPAAPQQVVAQPAPAAHSLGAQLQPEYRQADQPHAEPADWPFADPTAGIQYPPIAPVEPAVWSPPVGHWSMQGDIDDETQPYESTINRTIRSGMATTNALVLPSMPQPRSIGGPLTSTGEVMLTGSIDLPRTLGTNGTSARIEDDALDRLFDMNDHDLTSTDSAPVSAIRSVSTHNSNGHGVTHTQKPKGNRMLTILIGSAVAMAAAAVGLLIAAFATGVL